MFVLRPLVLSKSAQCETICKETVLSVLFSLTAKVSIEPEYSKKGSAIRALLSFKKPLKILTLSLTTFSFKQVEIKV